MALAGWAAPRIIAILVAGPGLPALPADARIDEANRLFLGGRYEEAERALTPLVVQHPEIPSLQRKLGLCDYYLRRPEPALTHLRAYLARASGISAQDREDVERWIREMEGLRDPTAAPAAPAQVSQPGASLSLSASPPPPSVRPNFRRGVLVLPYVGWQSTLQGPAWMTSGFRFGTLIGGRLSRNVSLSGEPAVATWTFLGNHHAAQMDASATLLYHVSGSRAELFIGPKLGWSVVLRNNFDEQTYMFVNGVQIGAKAGLFAALSDGVAIGVVVDLANTQSKESDSRCFEQSGFGELDCNNTDSTSFGVLSGALFF